MGLNKKNLPRCPVRLRRGVSFRQLIFLIGSITLDKKDLDFSVFNFFLTIFIINK